MSGTDFNALPADRPIPAVIAVLIRDGRTLLVQRRNPPDAGMWGFPGGKIETGEALQSAALRELYEETGVLATAGRAFTALDQLDVAADGMLRRHFILVAVLCHWVSGEPRAADDALDARWVALDDLDRKLLPLSAGVAAVARQAAALQACGGLAQD